jgi:acyl-CoA synthetase (NDP forming)
VSSGNEAATRSEDYLRFFAHDPKTKAILAYIEGTRDGRRLFETLRETAAKKPVVMVKGGRSQAGQKAAASHTGSLASTTALFEAACRQAGAAVVEDIYQGMELTSAFVDQPLPRGRRVVIVSEGGGWGVIGADACAAAGLDVIDLPTEILEELDRFMPGWWSRGNPIDLVAGTDRSLMSRSIETALKSPEVDAVLVLGVGYMCSQSARLRNSEEAERFGLTRLIEMATNMELHDVRRITGLTDLYEKPIIVASDTVMLAYGPAPNEAIAEMERLGIYAYDSPINAAKTLAHMVERYEFLNGIPRGGTKRVA